MVHYPASRGTRQNDSVVPLYCLINSVLVDRICYPKVNTKTHDDDHVSHLSNTDVRILTHMPIPSLMHSIAIFFKERIDFRLRCIVIIGMLEIFSFIDQFKV